MKYRLSNDEIQILEAWDNLIQKMLIHRDGIRLPGFPLWSDLWGKNPIYVKEKNSPEWKKNFERKNRQFYLEHSKVIDKWLKEFPIVRASSPSKRKLESQAQDAKSIWDCLIHFRPSGIRVKKANYVPALVAITQTTIIGPFKRRITPSEGALLQGLPIDFDFGDQSDQASYKQLGNGVAVGAVFQTVQALLDRDEEIIKEVNPKVLRNTNRNKSITNQKLNFNNHSS